MKTKRSRLHHGSVFSWCALNTIISKLDYYGLFQQGGQNGTVVYYEYWPKSSIPFTF